MTAPPGSATYQTRLDDLRIAAAVRVTFDLSEIDADDDPGTLLTFLDDSCDRVRTPDGKAVWSLSDEDRRRCLREVPLARLRTARVTAANVEPTPLQEALDRSITGGWRAEQLPDLTAEQARALSVVAGWWDGRRRDVPDPQAAVVLVDRLNLFADLRAMAADHFVGRAEVLDELRGHFLGAEKGPFALHGLGGVGKSAVIARHVAWATGDVGGRPRAYAAVIDFDDPMLNPAYRLDVVDRIIDLIGRQTDRTARPKLDRLREVSRDAAQNARFRAESSSRAAGGAQGSEVDAMLGDLVSAAHRPLLVVFDTVEQVQRRGSSAVASFAALVDHLTRFGARVRVVVAGRAPIPGLSGIDRELAGLARPEALELLGELSTRPVEARTAAAVVDSLGTSPLTLRLAARLISSSETMPGDLFALDLHAERVDAELYRRVLDFIRDDAVKRLAHPGLVLRRITPDLIRRVLARPCKVTVADKYDAYDLFERLSREAMLVDRSPDGQSLIHRADLRKVMLPQLLTDRRAVAERIQRAAVRYYAGRDDLTSKIEELYHRLMLEQTPATIAKHWDPRAGEALVVAMDELPTPSRILLSRLLPETYLSDEDRRLVGEARWREEVEPQVVRLLAVGEPDRAMLLLRERRGPDGVSLLPALEIEALEATGRLSTAIEIAADCRRTAAVADDASAVTTYTSHLARLLERQGDGVEAIDALQEAIASVRAPTVDRLRLLVALLGVWRRHHRPASDPDYAARRAEAVRLHTELGDREIRKVPGLLRDLAAEVGEDEPEILEDALGSIGVDASADGLVPGALRDLDDSVTAKHESPGVVADLARLDRTADEVAWDDIVTKPRGETGKALLEVMRTFGSSAEGLRYAVRADYQQEADAALFGAEITVAHKA